jgi:hypothetical protein
LLVKVQNYPLLPTSESLQQHIIIDHSIINDGYQQQGVAGATTAVPQQQHQCCAQGQFMLKGTVGTARTAAA